MRENTFLQEIPPTSNHWQNTSWFPFSGKQWTRPATFIITESLQWTSVKLRNIIFYSFLIISLHFDWSLQHKKTCIRNMVPIKSSRLSNMKSSISSPASIHMMSKCSSSTNCCMERNNWRKGTSGNNAYSEINFIIVSFSKSTRYGASHSSY